MDQLISGTSLRCLDFKEVKMGKLIGEGAFGKVHRCILRTNKRPLAAKVIMIPDAPEDRRLLQRELAVASRVPAHEHIVQLVGVSVNKGSVVVLGELMDESLSDVLQRMHPEVLTLDRVLHYARQIASAMHHLHSQTPAVVHRDLKSHNILLSQGGEICKLTDFGLSRTMVDEGLMTGETGSYRWMAPEVIRHDPYDQSCDVFSFALVLVELLTSMLPHPDKSLLRICTK
jgi:serine/threonine protein kinase